MNSTSSRWDGQSSVRRRDLNGNDLAMSQFSMQERDIDFNNQTIQSGVPYNQIIRGEEQINPDQQRRGTSKLEFTSIANEEDLSRSAISRKAQSNEVLSNLCDKIRSLKSILNGNVRNSFQLDSLVVRTQDEDGHMRVDFLPKEKLMDKLQDFDTLINAMGALFYVSRRMQAQIPCVLEAWKGIVFEK